LRQRQSAAPLDLPQPERAVAVHARQHHAGRQLAAPVRQRLEKSIDRQAMAAQLARRRQHAIDKRAMRCASRRRVSGK